MKTVILIRHAKASEDFSFKDFDRPLISTGIKNTISVANNFDIEVLKNVEVWCSTAKRTSETAVLFFKNFELNLDLIQYKKELYTFSVLDLESTIKSCVNNVENLIIFGHNNALTDFVNKFGDQYIDNIPTSGLVIIQFETNDWATIFKGKTLKTIFPSY